MLQQKAHGHKVEGGGGQACPLRKAVPDRDLRVAREQHTRGAHLQSASARVGGKREGEHGAKACGPAHHALVDLDTCDARVGQRLCKLERRPARAAAQLEQRRAVEQPVAPHVPQLCEGRLQLRGEWLPACLPAPAARV